MESKKAINDIKYLIMEHYSDKEPLNESQEKSKQCFYRYCDQLKKDLDRLEKLEKAKDLLSSRNIFIYVLKESYNFIDYNRNVSLNDTLAPDEYNILKEVFG